ncbi:MAG: UbiA prenyltransferase family protein [Candidatus Hodarchaeota archaeon]
MAWKDRLKAHFALTRPVQLVWLDIILPTSMFIILSRGFINLGLLFSYISMSILGDAGGCTLNDIGDLESDRRSSEKDRNQRPLVTGATTIRAAYFQGFILLGLCILMSFYRFPLLPVIVGVALFFALAYSFHPFKFKARPIISQLFWVIVTFLEFCAMVVWMDLPFEQALIGIPYIIAVLIFAAFGETLSKDLRDWDNDAEAGFRTTVVVFGPRASVRASVILGVGGALVWLITLAWIHQVSLIFLGIFGLLIIAMIWKFRPIYTTLNQGYSKPEARALHRFYLVFLVLFTCFYLVTVPFFILSYYSP